jgi:hypothetical protein
MRIARASLRAVRTSRDFAIAWLVATGAIGVARGEPTAGMANVRDDSGAIDDVVNRPLTLGAGDFEARLAVESGLSAKLKPIALAPDLWYGVTDRLTVGLIHSDTSLDQVDTTASFCFRGGVLSCDHVYNGSGVDVAWSALAGPFAIAPRVRFVVRDPDPFKPAGTVGALVRWAYQRFAIYADPYLRFGLANQALGNRTSLFIPVWFAVQPARGALLSLHTGWNSDLAVVSDGWHVPVAVDATVRVTAQIDVGLEAGLTSAFGPQNSVNNRALTLSVAYRP